MCEVRGLRAAASRDFNTVISQLCPAPWLRSATIDCCGSADAGAQAPTPHYLDQPAGPPPHPRSQIASVRAANHLPCPVPLAPHRSRCSLSMTRTGAARPGSGPFPAQSPTEGCANYRFAGQRGFSCCTAKQTKNLLTAPTPTACGHSVRTSEELAECAPHFPDSGRCGIEADDLPQGCHTRKVDSSTAAPTRMLRLTCPVLLGPVQHWRSACGRRQMKTGPPEAASPNPSVRRLRIGRLPDLAPPPAIRSPPHPAQNQHGTGHQG